MPGGPADWAGLQDGDVIVAIAGMKVKAPADVVTAIDRHGVNQPISLEIVRAGQRQTVRMTPVEMRSLQS